MDLSGQNIPLRWSGPAAPLRCYKHSAPLERARGTIALLQTFLERSRSTHALLQI